MSRKQTDYATIRLLASVVAFPLFWALETLLVGWAAGLAWALAFFLSLPLGGLIAYRYLVGTGRLLHQLRFGALFLTRAQVAPGSHSCDLRDPHRDEEPGLTILRPGGS